MGSNVSASFCDGFQSSARFFISCIGKRNRICISIFLLLMNNFVVTLLRISHSIKAAHCKCKEDCQFFLLLHDKTSR